MRRNTGCAVNEQINRIYILRIELIFSVGEDMDRGRGNFELIDRKTKPASVIFSLAGFVNAIMQ